jgi:hypothetical protein
VVAFTEFAQEAEKCKGDTARLIALREAAQHAIGEMEV